MKKRSRLIILIIVLLLLATHFVFKASRTGSEPLLIDRMIAAAYSPPARLFNRISRFTANTVNKYFLLVRTQEENRVLRENLELLRIQNQSLWKLVGQKQERDSARLFYADINYELNRVAVLGHDPFAQSQMLWIDAGKNQGVGINTVVISGRGLVGRVIEVFDNTGKVLLLVDSYFAVDVYNERTGVRCLVRGTRSGDLEMARYPYLSQIEYTEKNQEFKKGDVLTTSGVGGIYPRGIQVGTVAQIEISSPAYVGKAMVMPAVDFAKLTDVYVLLKQEVRSQKSEVRKMK